MCELIGIKKPNKKYKGINGYNVTTLFQHDLSLDFGIGNRAEATRKDLQLKTDLELS